MCLLTKLDVLQLALRRQNWANRALKLATAGADEAVTKIHLLRPTITTTATHIRVETITTTSTEALSIILAEEVALMARGRRRGL